MDLETISIITVAIAAIIKASKDIDLVKQVKRLYRWVKQIDLWEAIHQNKDRILKLEKREYEDED